MRFVTTTFNTNTETLTETINYDAFEAAGLDLDPYIGDSDLSDMCINSDELKITINRTKDYGYDVNVEIIDDENKTSTQLFHVSYDRWMLAIDPKSWSSYRKALNAETTHHAAKTAMEIIETVIGPTAGEIEKFVLEEKRRNSDSEFMSCHYVDTVLYPKSWDDEKPVKDVFDYLDEQRTIAEKIDNMDLYYKISKVENTLYKEFNKSKYGITRMHFIKVRVTDTDIEYHIFDMTE